MSAEQERAWTVEDATDLYNIARWGDDYFHVSDQGTMLVSPGRDPSQSIDLKQLVDTLGQRGLQLPILVRFNGILCNRLERMNECFAKAIKDHDYRSRYCCVFPIKVNQQREVVQQIIKHGQPFGFGVEAGSKPELLAVVAMTDARTPIICNGFKDADFIRMALLAQRMGRTVIPVIEKVSELDLVLEQAELLGVRPTLGMRVKLATRGSGRWQASGGYRSKFGLTVAEMLRQLDRLAERGMADCFELLHFHVGSQIGNIRHLKSAILEAARIYVGLKQQGAGLKYLDVGGGLGVDYDGTRTDTESSMNYSLQEYANDVVFHVQSVCNEAEVDHPILVSESGRAIAAQHSVLIVDTVGVTTQGSAHGNALGNLASVPEDYEQPVRDLWDSFQNVTKQNVLETFHDSQVALDLCMNLFSGGYLPLDQRVFAEDVYFAICHRVRAIASELDEFPAELKVLNRMLSDTYFANFSLFQSLPDSWAINQLFPIVPIHRLDEEPTHHAILGDITCDSDGKVDTFVCGASSKKTLRLHEKRPGEPYQIAIFLVGAYQEVLGDLHNLFGDTHAVHVDVRESGFKIESVVKGDTVSEVLGYMQYNDRELIENLQNAIEEALQTGSINNEQAGQTIDFYEKALQHYTYLS